MSSQDDPNEPQFTVEEISAIVEEAHFKHRKVAAHAQANIGIRNAVKCGVDTIEHALNLDEETCREMIAKQTIIVPTMVSPLMTSTYGASAGVPEWAVRKTTEALEPHKRSVSMAKRMGVKIGFGTDGGTPFNYHGANAKEFKIMVERGGLSEGEALLAATGIAAEALGKKKMMGSLEAGKVADIVVVKGDPLANIACLEDPANIVLVLKDGKVEKKTESRI
jgi:imidazolonepropionase-like amidohydrolase